MDEVTSLYSQLEQYFCQYTMINEVQAGRLIGDMLNIMHKNGFELISQEELESLKEKAWKYDSLCD